MLNFINKRQRFIVTTIILSLGLVFLQVADLSWRYFAILALVVISYFLSAWSLQEGLTKIEWLTVLSLPTLFTGSVAIFYFLVPTNWLARLPIIIIYALCMYALFLTENIFSVAAIRTIQLLRSAQAVGFLLTLITSFFLFDTILSYRFSPLINMLLVSVISFPLFLQGLWSVRLGDKIDRRLFFYSLSIILVIAQMALAFSFWPVSVAVGSLALCTVIYITLGLYQHQLTDRLFVKTVREYLAVGAIVLLVIFLTTRWGG